MIGQRITIEKELLSPYARENFIKISRLNIHEERDRKMMEAAEEVRKKGLAGIDVRALLCRCSRDILRNFSFDYLAQIPMDAVQDVYCYMITAGECLVSNQEDILETLYADMWGTSYVDAGLDFLTKHHIESELESRFHSKIWLSPSFGPGYFGMPVEETKTFFTIFNGEEIGVKLTSSGVMHPQKTCTGFYLVYRENIKTDSCCRTCLGNAGGCQFCTVRKEI